MRSPQFLAAVCIVALPTAALAVSGTRQAASAGAQQRRFEAMDTNRDGVISRAEWRGTEQSFRAHDWNRDGVLSNEELRVGTYREVDEGDDYDQSARPQFRNWTARGFESLDRNHDGEISRAEWFYDREGFIRADRNGDGTLTRAEFLGADVDADREDRFEYLDANGDGRIQRSEWHASRDAFQWLDRNRDGVLSRTEVMGDDNQPTDLFAALDANGDRVVTSDEWRWSRRSFARQDRNGDGQLSRDELTNTEIGAMADPMTPGGVERSVIVDGSRTWVDTGVDVRTGDRIVFTASGAMTLSDNSQDAAEPNGARSGRRAQSAPMSDQPAGALIGRVGSSTPLLIGSQHTITADRSGRLYLGVNDDFLDDNRGEYRVSITVQRR